MRKYHHRSLVMVIVAIILTLSSHWILISAPLTLYVSLRFVLLGIYLKNLRNEKELEIFVIYFIEMWQWLFISNPNAASLNTCSIHFQLYPRPSFLHMLHATGLANPVGDTNKAGFIWDLSETEGLTSNTYKQCEN
jgi:hypothetical protein